MTTADPAVNTANYTEQGGARTVIGGEIDIVTGGKLKINGADVTSTVAGAGVAGIASGYILARSNGAVAVTGTSAITTGLTTILAASVTLAEDAAISGDAVSFTISGGTLTAKVWKRTATGDCTPIAATSAKNITWIAVGT